LDISRYLVTSSYRQYVRMIPERDGLFNWIQTPLLRAAELGHLEIIKLLLDCADIDVDCTVEGISSRTPLSHAAEGGHWEVVNLLLGRGACSCSKDRTDRTPLSYAAEGGHCAIVNLLLEKGAEPCCRDQKNRTPLSYAAREWFLGDY
jgi:ankyrin repeat protein